MEKSKIYVAEYLKILNENVNYNLKWHYIKKNDIKIINCKELANLCNVTQATISNLNTDSKFSLIYKIAEKIYECYYSYFEYDEKINKKEYPDENIQPRDIYYIIEELTKYYTKEWYGYLN